MRRGYAVLDFETTGFSPKTGDRVIEVGAVYMDADLRIDGGIETLVNPQRDVGPTRVHGITARDVFDAPTFDKVAPALLKMLDGRVIVGHNVSFDLRFLTAELEREGYEVPDYVAIDTMQVARTLLREDPPASFKLHDLGAHLGVTIEKVFEYVGLEQRPEHSAFGDALVTAFVLSRLEQDSHSSGFWKSHLDSAEAVKWPEYYPIEIDAKRRGDAAAMYEEPAEPFAKQAGGKSASVSDVLTALGAEAPSRGLTSRYSHLLDEALADRVLDADEVDALVQKAQELGLESVTLGSLHRGYFDEVVREAWSDGVLTEEERADILLLAELLGIDDDSLRVALEKKRSEAPNRVVPDASTATDAAVLAAGSILVLTGEMSVERSLAEARILALGFLLGANVTKKTALVIAADPYTQSGKAKKARAYGIPVVGEADGFRLIGY